MYFSRAGGAFNCRPKQRTEYHVIFSDNVYNNILNRIGVVETVPKETRSEKQGALQNEK